MRCLSQVIGLAIVLALLVYGASHGPLALLVLVSGILQWLALHLGPWVDGVIAWLSQRGGAQ